MNEEHWTLIREGMEKVAAGLDRVDFSTSDAQISVYKVVNIIRCDIKPPKQ